MYNHFKITVFITGLVFLTGLILSLVFSYVSSDAPYYLSVARDISQGSVPYKDIYLSYTPLMMYLNALVFLIFEQNHYNYFLFFQFVIIFFSQFVFFKTIRKYFQLSRWPALFLAVILGIAILSSDGNYINLEVYSLLCVLSAFYFYKGNAYILTGFCLGLSFFFKQYGILNFLPFYLLILFSRENVFSKILYLSCGGIIPLILFLGYFMGAQQIPLMSIINQLSGVEYIKYAVSGAPSLISWLIGGKVFVMLLFCVALIHRKDFKKPVNIALLIGVLVNLLPTFVQSFQHYYLNTFPYIFILLVYNWNNNYAKVFKPLILSVILIAGLLFFRSVKYRNVYQQQLIMANVVENYITKGNEVFLNGGVRFLYFLNNYQNPIKEKIGYSYLSNLDQNLFENIKVLSHTPLKSRNAKKILLADEKFYIKLSENTELE